VSNLFTCATAAAGAAVLALHLLQLGLRAAEGEIERLRGHAAEVLALQSHVLEQQQELHQAQHVGDLGGGGALVRACIPGVQPQVCCGWEAGRGVFNAPSLSSCRWCFHCPRSLFFFFSPGSGPAALSARAMCLSRKCLPLS